jgi:hypothetical protein
MATWFEVRSGRLAVAQVEASSAQEAVTEYLRGIGCRDDEIRRMGKGVASWRGAIYKAVPAPGDAPPRRRAA